MALTITCPHCKRDGEHAEIYRGCMRPCPHCGELVSLATAEDAPVKLAPTEECWCGKARDERGLDFALGYRHYEQPGWLYIFLAHYVPLLLLIYDFFKKRAETKFVEGWACEECRFRVRWMWIWLWTEGPLILLFWGLLMSPIFLDAKAMALGLHDALMTNRGLWTTVAAVVGGILVWHVWWSLLSRPVHERFGKGNIVKVKILEP